MRKIVTGLFMSLDGVVEADNDWQFAYVDEEVFDSIAELNTAAASPHSPCVELGNIGVSRRNPGSPTLVR